MSWWQHIWYWHPPTQWPSRWRPANAPPRSAWMWSPCPSRSDEWRRCGRDCATSQGPRCGRRAETHGDHLTRETSNRRRPAEVDVIKRRCTEGAGDEEEKCKTGEGAEIRGKASFNDLRAIKLASSDLWNISVQREYLIVVGSRKNHLELKR